MPALKPLPSPARLVANRANAAKSTGPRTEAGQARSRRNAIKHGLTGEGIALPTEDAAEVAGRFAALRDQLRPATPLGEHYVGRIALAAVRADRAARHEAAALAWRARHAVEEFDIARAAEADDALARLRDGQARGARRDLLRTPEGIDRLIAELRRLRGCLALPEPLWSREHGARLDACLGVAPDPLVPSRVEALSGAALGIADDLLTRRDLAAIAEAGVPAAAYALGQVVALIDAEVAALGADRAAIDPAAIEADRAGAADRALFDPSPAAQLARRYEAAAAREVARSLRLLREVEAAAPPLDETPAEATPAPEPADPATAVPRAAAGPIEGSATIAGNPMPENDFGPPLGSFGSGPSVVAGGRCSGPGPGPAPVVSGSPVVGPPPDPAPAALA